MDARAPGKTPAGMEGAAERRLLSRGVGLAVLSVLSASAVTAFLEQRGRVGHDLGHGLEALIACLLLGALGYAWVFVPLRAGARRREEQLRAALAAERTLRGEIDRLGAATPVGIAFLDADARVTRANAKLASLLGVGEAALEGRSLADLFPGRDLSALLRADLGVGASEPVEIELGAGDATRSVLVDVLRFGGAETRDGSAALLRVADVTEARRRMEAVETARRGAEAALERERATFRALLDSSAMLVWKCDASGACDYFNRTWLDFTGRSAEEEHGDGWAAGVHPDDLAGCLDVFRAALATGAPFRMEYRLRRHDGVYRWILDTGAPIRDAEGAFRGFVGSCVDVTAMHDASEEARRSNEGLRALSHRLVSVQEEERRLLARELHDGLGQTLTGLAFGLRWCAQRCPDPQGEVGQRLNEMLRELEGAILEVRDLSRRLRPASLDLGLVAALETEVAAFRRRTGLTCDFEAPAEKVHLDSGRALSLFRVAQEALVNVARHARASRVVVRVSGGDGVVRLEVADDGRGFDEAALGSADAFGLTGLRERLAPFGGRFRVERNEPTGTRVVAELPAGLPADAAKGMPA